MRIGIITIFKANNYGAELQAFALQKKLELMGYESELIDYPFYKHPSHQKSRQDNPLFTIGFNNRVKEALYPIWQRVAGISRRRERAIRTERMKDFHKDYTRLSGQTFCSLEQLYRAVHPYDVFMVGSDQVWNPRMNCSLDPYFLTFAPPGKRRVSYASSFGVSELPDACRGVFKERLALFDDISVREKRGRELVRELIGREATHVLDPTLLLDRAEWESVAKMPEGEKEYVLLYELIPSRPAIQLAQEVARKLGISRIVRLCGDAMGRRVEGIEDAAEAGPSEFVGYFKKAAFVVTNSFHGTAFSVNFQKSFFTVIPSLMSNTGRISSFLELAGLSHRQVAQGGEATREPTANIDFDEVGKRLEFARQASCAYLSRAISG